MPGLARPMEFMVHAPPWAMRGLGLPRRSWTVVVLATTAPRESQPLPAGMFSP